MKTRPSNQKQLPAISGMGFFQGKIHLIILFALSLIILSCSKEDATLTNNQPANGARLKNTGTVITPLIAGQNMDAGTVTATFDTYLNELTVTYSTVGTDFKLYQTHLDVQIDPALFPQTKNGNPRTGHFQYGANLGGKTEWTQVIDLTSIEGYEVGYPVYIAAHAVVRSNTNQTETGWGQGLPFPGNNWAMYFSIIPENPPS